MFRTAGAPGRQEAVGRVVGSGPRLQAGGVAVAAWRVAAPAGALRLRRVRAPAERQVPGRRGRPGAPPGGRWPPPPREEAHPPAAARHAWSCRSLSSLRRAQPCSHRPPRARRHADHPGQVRPLAVPGQVAQVEEQHRPRHQVVAQHQADAPGRDVREQGGQDRLPGQGRRPVADERADAVAPVGRRRACGGRSDRRRGGLGQTPVSGRVGGVLRRAADATLGSGPARERRRRDRWGGAQSPAAAWTCRVNLSSRR
jgi:hypothetical protein